MQNSKINTKKSPARIKPKAIKKKQQFFEKPLFHLMIILAFTLIAFLPSLQNDFITSWDDDLFITENPMIRHLDLQSIKSIFITPVTGAYVPLPVLTFAVEYHFFGLNPFPYHIANLILHLICTMLVFHLLRSLQLNSLYAAFGALLFGIHPMHVESVAWITERKDLLYGIFYLASIIVYLKYIRSHGQGFNFFIPGLLFFILALFSKIQAVTLPLSLLLIDYYLKRNVKMKIPVAEQRGIDPKIPTPYPLPAGREGKGWVQLKLILEKIPYFILSFVFGIAGLFILNQSKAFHYNEILHLSDRIFSGLYALGSYIVKFFVPVHLSAVYPFPQNPANSLPILYYLNPFFLLILGYFIYRTVRYTRAIVFGILFYLFNVIFMLQILAAGSTYLSDRYSYMSYVGFCFVAGWSLDNLAKNKKDMKHIIIPVMAIVIILFGSMTFNRCKIWKDEGTLWTDAIEKYPGGMAIPYNNHGVFCNRNGNWEMAKADFTEAIRLDTNFAEAYSNRSVVYGNLKEWDKAISDCSRAIGINPNNEKSYSNRGLTYWNLKEWDKAIADYSKAISINPNFADAYLNRGIAFGSIGDWNRSISDCSMAIGINPNDEKTYSTRGKAYGSLGQWDKALADYSKAIIISPNAPGPYSNRGTVYGLHGEWNKAVADYSTVIGIDPNYKDAYFNRGIAYWNLKESDKAISDYSSAIGIDPGNAQAYVNRGVAYAYLGQWDKAISDNSRAIEIDPSFAIAYTNREVALRYLKGGKK